MPLETTYTQARANLANLWDRVTQDHEVVIIQRRGAEPVALISADELSGLMETAHLLKSPKNAKRLMRALQRALSEEGSPQTVDSLKRQVGLGS